MALPIMQESTRIKWTHKQKWSSYMIKYVYAFSIQIMLCKSYVLDMSSYLAVVWPCIMWSPPVKCIWFSDFNTYLIEQNFKFKFAKVAVF